MKEISSSEIAKLMATPAKADEAGLEYGKECEEKISMAIYRGTEKLQEEEYTTTPERQKEIDALTDKAWVDRGDDDKTEWSFSGNCEICNKRYHFDPDKYPPWEYDDSREHSTYMLCSKKCFEEFIYQDLDEFQMKLCKALIAAGCVGQTPPTECREKRGILVYAKPDLWEPGIPGTYHEFKTYPLNDYARAQSKVFSWVLNCPINLYGWDEATETLQHEVISDLKGSDIPDFSKIAKEEEEEDDDEGDYTDDDDEED